jgi:hypothetical protein
MREKRIHDPVCKENQTKKTIHMKAIGVQRILKEHDKYTPCPTPAKKAYYQDTRPRDRVTTENNNSKQTLDPEWHI